jgi:hypothetical protein
MTQCSGNIAAAIAADAGCAGSECFGLIGHTAPLAKWVQRRNRDMWMMKYRWNFHFWPNRPRECNQIGSNTPWEHPK